MPLYRTTTTTVFASSSALTARTAYPLTLSAGHEAYSSHQSLTPYTVTEQYNPAGPLKSSTSMMAWRYAPDVITCCNEGCLATSTCCSFQLATT